MKNILFPTDFSEAANRAFIYALHMARKFEAQLITLHVYQKPDLSPGVHLPITLAKFYETIDLHEFESYKDSIPALRTIAEQNGFADVPVDHVLEEGETVDTILEVARRDNINMIVMGTTGARGLKEILLGSIAGEILENANCPVLAIPAQSTFDGIIDRIAFTTSFKEEEQAALHKVLQLATIFEAQVSCINVDLAHTHDLTQRMETFKKAFEGTENLTFQVLDGTDIRKVIMDFVDQENIDVVAMVTHKRNFLEELFHYSRAKQMSYHADTPVLSIQAHTLTQS
jgi:nucleotide-binding universal stress UspA family protein